MTDWDLFHVHYRNVFGNMVHSSSSPHSSLEVARTDAEGIVRKKRTEAFIYKKVETVDLVFKHQNVEEEDD